MKKTLFIVLALSAILTFTSCAEKETSSGEVSSKDVEVSIETSQAEDTSKSEESSEKAEEYGEYGKKISKFYSNMFEKDLVMEEKTIFGMSSEGARAYIYKNGEKTNHVECTFYGESGCASYFYAILDEETMYCIVVDTDYSYTYDDEEGIVEWDNVNVEKTTFHYIIENETVYEYNVETGNIGKTLEEEKYLIEQYETIITVEDGGNPNVPSSLTSNE